MFGINTYTLLYFKWITKNFPGKESASNAGDLGSIPGLGRAPGGGHGNPLQYSCLENPHGQRSLAGHSPWGRKQSDVTERLGTEHKQRGPTVLHVELWSLSRGSQDGVGVWGRMDTYLRMAELFCCPPETITTLLISYTPM